MTAEKQNQKNHHQEDTKTDPQKKHHDNQKEPEAQNTESSKKTQEDHEHHESRDEEHESHDEHASHGNGNGHGDHQDHHAHMVEDFKRRFWISLVLTLPMLVLSPMLQDFFGLEEQFAFTGDLYVLWALATAVFFYGGWPFLKGLYDELKSAEPGMMTLIAVAITTAYVYSSAVVFGLGGKVFFWELATLIDIMLLGHWIEMRSIMGASHCPMGKGRGMMGGGLMRDFHQWMKQFMAHRSLFDLTPEQMTRLDDIIMGHMKNAIQNKADIRVAKVDLRQMIRQTPMDLSTVENQLNQVESLKTDFQMEVIRLYSDLLNMLNDQQKAKVEEIIGTPFPAPWEKMFPESGDTDSEDNGMEMEKPHEEHPMESPGMETDPREEADTENGPESAT